ncbi:type II toxin-antitoxin system VapC family toxin [Paralysiella testudinis]|uniref:Type II toxin-antitoxin system VapC family toxin n=1 Tax=Paralysiella testudinis TaxID=2809020 RepID=A0A892ZMM8_9NEIS|nr:type II toxin-antitoxin system VapC family toxin [Paralysiella testudinis]QRQ82874.1 type II toxin-antitoxin system VapC family toxin [Paralysiella testudinis]
MRIAVDTNVLVRLLTNDHPEQVRMAVDAIRNAEQICVPTHVFCELVWVLSRTYEYGLDDIQKALESLIQLDGLIYAEDEVAAGMEQLRLGGDFADGINEYTGNIMGANQFVTFDKKAVTIMKKRHRNALYLKSDNKPKS